MSDRTVSETAQPQLFTPALMRRVLISTINRYFDMVKGRDPADQVVTVEELAAVGAAGTAFAELTRLITEEQEWGELMELKAQIDRLEKQLLVLASSGSRSVA